MTTIQVLARQDDFTTQSVIRDLQWTPTFENLAKNETMKLIKKDKEDAKVLRQNVELAIEKGTLQYVPGQPYVNVSVRAKLAEQVADEIIEDINRTKPKNAGCVVTLVGLPDKEFVISKLKEKFPHTYSLSIDNCFRALTLLAVQYCKLQRLENFDAKVLTAENLEIWMTMLRLVKIGGNWDIRISRMVNALVSECWDTRLRTMEINNNLTAVARAAYGEVVHFAANTCKEMVDEGTVVLMEGREQTLDYISSNYRYCLIMEPIERLGLQRAAKLVAGDVITSLNKDIKDLFKSHLEKRTAVKDGEYH